MSGMVSVNPLRDWACCSSSSSIAIVVRTRFLGIDRSINDDRFDAADYANGRFCRSSATISAAAARALSPWSGGKLMAPTRAWPPPP
jgi:hypothetical protein